jgi:hypothetical protein
VTQIVADGELVLFHVREQGSNRMSKGVPAYAADSNLGKSGFDLAVENCAEVERLLSPLADRRKHKVRNRRHKLRLRTVSELFPEVIQGELDGDGLPSCSAAEALDRQEPFVNPTLANHTLGLLARLFRYGTISYHGGFVRLSSLSSVQALRVDPNHWQRFRNRRRLSKHL